MNSTVVSTEATNYSLLILLYGAETQPMTVINMNKLEAAHHKWQRKILGISWREKVTNEEVRWHTGQEQLEDSTRRQRNA